MDEQPTAMERARAKLAAMTPDEKRDLWGRLCVALDHAPDDDEANEQGLRAGGE